MCTYITNFKFLYFWLNYSDKKNHIERILVAEKYIDHLLCMASEKLESGKLHLYLLLDSIPKDNNKYLVTLEAATALRSLNTFFFLKSKNTVLFT